MEALPKFVASNYQCEYSLPNLFVIAKCERTPMHVHT